MVDKFVNVTYGMNTEDHVLGYALIVNLIKAVNKDEEVVLRVWYQTNRDALAINWLT